MEIRSAVENDTDRIDELARQSFQASYSLSPQDIDAIARTEFSDDAVEECIQSDDDRILVAEDDDLVVGFAETHLTDDQDGEIRWLHVDPAVRGQGIGTELFEQAAAQLRERTAEHVHAIVMAANEEGNQFFEQWGLERGESDQREIGEETYRIQIFTATPEEFADEQGMTDDDEEFVPQDGEITVAGEIRYVDVDEEVPGDDGRFYVVYEEPSADEKYGFYCSNCGTFTSNVDGMGTITCQECGNVHRPDDWDMSYL